MPAVGAQRSRKPVMLELAPESDSALLADDPSRVGHPGPAPSSYPPGGPPPPRAYGPRFWGPSPYFSCSMVVWNVILTVGLFAAFAFSGRNHWERNGLTNNIVSKDSTANVEVRADNDLIIHNRLLHEGEDVAIDKVSFTPVLPIGPTGDDFVFGDQAVTYTRVQAGLAIGFRLGTNSFLTPPGILLGEEDLKVLIEPLGVHIASVLVPFFGVFIPSDERIKTNITALNATQAFRDVMNLRPRAYHYIDDWHRMMGEETLEQRGSRRHGFIAQEVEEVLPHSVRRTTVNLENRVIDDFRELRKEDLVTEVVSAFQCTQYETVLDLAYAMAMPWDAVGGGPNNNVAQWVKDVRSCLTAKDSDAHARAECVCVRLARFCDEGGSTGSPGCADDHPLRRRCAIVV